VQNNRPHEGSHTIVRGASGLKEKETLGQFTKKKKKPIQTVQQLQPRGWGGGGGGAVGGGWGAKAMKEEVLKLTLRKKRSDFYTITKKIHSIPTLPNN